MASIVRHPRRALTLSTRQQAQRRLRIHIDRPDRNGGQATGWLARSKAARV
jgi:hypothetical protein